MYCYVVFFISPSPRTLQISILFFGFASAPQLLPRDRSDLFGGEVGLPGDNDTKWYRKPNVYSLKEKKMAEVKYP
jgi:hypothetical protein